MIGNGSYTITTLGDGRAMTLNNPPALALALTYNRVFVERAGKVWFGYQNRTALSSRVRLNNTASNALLSQLGLPAVNPGEPLALTAASYQGTWDLTDPAGAAGNGTAVTLSATATSSAWHRAP